MPKTIIDNNNELLVKASPGKENQSAQKPGGVCWYYAENYIRYRQKSKKKAEPSTEREIEKFHSAVRKKLSLAELVHAEILTMLDVCIQNGKVVLQVLENILQTIKAEIKNNTTKYQENPHWKAVEPALIEIINKVKSKAITSEQELRDFLRSKQNDENDQTYEKALEDKNVTFIRSGDKHKVLTSQYHKLRRKDYQLQISKWQPAHGFDALLMEIKQHGPLVMNGYFGRYVYREKPKAANFYDWTLFTFDEKTLKKEVLGNAVTHAVVLVGGKRISADKQLLYYIDPHDAHTKDKPAPYYAIEYKNFAKKCCSTSGLYPVDDTISDDNNEFYFKELLGGILLFSNRHNEENRQQFGIHHDTNLQAQAYDRTSFDEYDRKKKFEPFAIRHFTPLGNDDSKTLDYDIHTFDTFEEKKNSPAK